ncbi:MAG: SDR family oxidoreductase [Vicingaceae bacterium]
MKVLVIGANGKIGTLLSEKLAKVESLEPLAMIRKAEQRAKFEAMNVPTVLASLDQSVEALSETIKMADVVVFTAGSGGGTGAEKTLEVDLDGAVKSMLAAEQEKVKRYVMVSAAGADIREFWPKSGIKPYYIAKHFADQALKQSNLDYTILRPVMLTDNSAKGKIKIEDSPAKLNKEVSREDVANVIVESLKNNTTKRKLFEFSEGETLIEEAIN